MSFEVGFYGKLPSHGDFLRRRVPDGFVERWDPWLQECFLESRDVLGDRWLDVYLTSPLWRFAAGAGVLDVRPVIGVTAPSVDKVGRYFNLTLVVPLSEAHDALCAALISDQFFVAAERLAVETLAAERIDFAEFDRQVSALSGLLRHLNDGAGMLDAAASLVLAEGGFNRWRIATGDAPGNAGQTGMLQSLAIARLSQVYQPLVTLWTEGSEYVEPSFLVGRGLPSPDSFAALLTGNWSDGGWRSMARASTYAPDPDTVRLAASALAPLVYRSAGASDVGCVRTVNQDAFLERPEVGLWVVADGLGGHDHGEVASRMICDTLADVRPAATMQALVEAVSERVRQVNSRLHQVSRSSEEAVLTGSTIVALVTRGSEYAAVWAGDSRLYRWRDGQLEQLTQDHSADEMDGDGKPTSAITRAVGADAELVLDISRGQVSPGDRFLLCSDGLTRAASALAIQEGLSASDLETSASTLIRATLDAGAPDNVSVVVVDAQPHRTTDLKVDL